MVFVNCSVNSIGRLIAAGEAVHALRHVGCNRNASESRPQRFDTRNTAVVPLNMAHHIVALAAGIVLPALAERGHPVLREDVIGGMLRPGDKFRD